MDSSQPLNGEIIPPQPASPPKPKALEDQILDDLGRERGQQAIDICEALATQSRSVAGIAAEIMRRTDEEHAKRLFFRWRMRSAPLGHLYARAREARAHMLVDEIVEIADEPYAETAADKIKAEAETRKVKIEARKWTAGKYNRLLYGDEPQKHGVQVTINNAAGASALEEIRRRLAKKRKAMLADKRDKPEP